MRGRLWLPFLLSVALILSLVFLAVLVLIVVLILILIAHDLFPPNLFLRILPRSYLAHVFKIYPWP